MSLSNFVHGTVNGWSPVNQTWSQLVWSGSASSTEWPCHRVTYTNPNNYPVYITGMTLAIGVGYAPNGIYADSGALLYISDTSITVTFKIGTEIFTRTVNNTCNVQHRGTSKDDWGYFYIPEAQTFTFDSHYEIAAHGTLNIYFGKTSAATGIICVGNQASTLSATEKEAVIHVTGVSVSPTSMTLATLTNTGGVATSGTITPTVSPDNATNKNVSWSTSAAGVASISSGTVTPVGAGNATITCTTIDGGYTATTSVNVYSNPSVSDVKIKVSSTDVSLVNGNTGTTISWTENSNQSFDTYTKSVDIYSSNTKVYTISSNPTSGLSFTPTGSAASINALLPYDNTDVSVRVTKTHSNTLLSDYASHTLKIRFRPVTPVANMTAALGDVYSNQSKTISWSVPSGYNGIYSGYQIVFYDMATSTELNPIYTTNTSYTLDYSLFTPTHTYGIKIQPYYLYNNNRYINTSALTDIPNYFTYYIYNTAGPTIITPTSLGKWYGTNYKVLIQMPADGNYTYLSQADQAAYRYGDVEIVLNGNNYSILDYPDLFSKDISDLTYQCYIIFNAGALTTSINGNNELKSKCKYGCNPWNYGDYSTKNYTLDVNIPIINFIKGEYILWNTFNRLETIINETRLFNIPNAVQKITGAAQGTIINASNYSSLASFLSEIHAYITVYNDNIVHPEDFDYYTISPIDADEHIGEIIYAMGLAQYIYELILRTLGIDDTIIDDLMYALTHQCRVTELSTDDYSYTYTAYTLISDIINVLGESHYVPIDDETEEDLAALLAGIEAKTGISYPEETDFRYDHNIEYNADANMSDIEIAVRG